MSNEAKPRLLFLRFTKPDVPSFLQRHLQEQIKCLSQFFEVVVINDHTCDYKQLCETHEPDIAMFESGSYVGERNVANVSACPAVPRIGFANCDAYCPTRKNVICDMDRWDISTLFTLSVSLASYTPSIADKLFVWPNFIDPKLYRDYGFPKVIPVLFSGSQASNYPWRNRIDRIVSPYYPSLHSPHFGWHWKKNGKPSAMSLLEGEQYAQLLNSAWVAPTCGTIANELVRKHFEIPACNTCLLTEKTAALEAAGFIDLVNCVFADERDVLDKLEWLFQNPDEPHRIIKAGKQLVDSRHTIEHRDQIFQWFTLHKKLIPGQRIVQPGPFLPLTIVDENSGTHNGHAVSNGLDQLLMTQADQKLRSGNFNEAEKLYRRCVNYHVLPVAESRFRLILCLLNQGNAKAALAMLRELFPSHRVIGKNEPDPTEWAWFIIALLCCGKLREAALRADQFTTLHNEELTRVRRLVSLLCRQNLHALSDHHQAGQRASVHQPLWSTTDEWLKSVRNMLQSCGQEQFAQMLAHPGSQLLEASETSNKQLSERSPVKNAALAYYLAAGSRARRATQRNKLRLKRLRERITGILRYHAPSVAEDDRAAIVRLLQREEFQSGILIGAADGSWLSDAFICGLQDNPNMPSAVCVNYDTPAFRRFHRRFADNTNVEFRYLPSGSDFQTPPLPLGEGWGEGEPASNVIAIDSSDKLEGLNCKSITATLLLLGRINSQAGQGLFQAINSNENYRLLIHEPSCCNGYAIFRRLTAKAAQPNQHAA